MYDVAVIGAGVVGTLCARELARYRLSVILLEAEEDVAVGATKANSAIVHAGFDAEEGTLKARFNVEGSKRMKRLTEELGVAYKQNGSLVLAFSDEDMALVRRLYERGVNNGVAGVTVLDQDALRKKEANVSGEAIGALFAPTGAICCPYGLAIAACGNAMDNGVHLRCGFCVSSIRREGGAFLIASGKEVIRSRFVINAAGLYADEIGAMLGQRRHKITPRRGEYFLLDKSQGSLISSTVFVTPSAMGKGILVTPTVDGNLLVGPTAEGISDKADVDTTDEGGSLLRTQALRSVPGMDLRAIITSFSGNRAVGETGDFIFETSEGAASAIGIESPGLSASIAIADYMIGLLGDMGLALEENKHFCPTRRPFDWFRRLSREEKNRVIADNPAYGRIVCRCEGITEGEILDALTQAPAAHDLDGVKRRTRAGMGRCQGGFCSPSVVGLIAREHHLPYESVTKRGGDSVINVGKKEGGASDGAL